MSEDITKVILEEFREHRKETNRNFVALYNRVGNIETRNAYQDGQKIEVEKNAKKVAGITAVIFSTLVTAVIKFGEKIWP